MMMKYRLSTLMIKSSRKSVILPRWRFVCLQRRRWWVRRWHRRWFSPCWHCAVSVDSACPDRSRLLRRFRRHRTLAIRWCPDRNGFVSDRVATESKVHSVLLFVAKVSTRSHRADEKDEDSALHTVIFSSFAFLFLAGGGSRMKNATFSAEKFIGRSTSYSIEQRLVDDSVALTRWKVIGRLNRMSVRVFILIE